MIVRPAFETVAIGTAKARWGPSEVFTPSRQLSTTVAIHERGSPIWRGGGRLGCCVYCRRNLVGIDPSGPSAGDPPHNRGDRRRDRRADRERAADRGRVWTWRHDIR